AADVLAGTDEIAQRLLVAARNADRVQTADHQQPNEPLSVPPVCLDTVLRWTLDLPRRSDDADDAGSLERARELEPGRAGLVANTEGKGKPPPERRQLVRCPRQPVHAHLPRARVDDARHRRCSVHIQTRPGANLGHGRFLLLGCGRRASASRAATTTPIASGDRPCLTAAPDVRLHTV